MGTTSGDAQLLSVDPVVGMRNCTWIVICFAEAQVFSKIILLQGFPNNSRQS